MITTEECVAREDDSLSIDPVLSIFSMFLLEDPILDAIVPSSRAQSITWNREFVRQNLIRPFCSQSSRESHEGHVDRSRPGREYFVPCTPRVPIQVDQDVNPIFHNLLDETINRPTARVVEDGRFPLNLLAVDGIVTWRGRVAVSLNSVRIVEPKDRLHQMGQRMVVEVRRDISHSQVRVRRGWRRIHRAGKPRRAKS